jgi:hypothetical protein
VPIWAENPRDWQHKIPKIKTSSGEILTTNDPTHDDVLLCNYNYDMFRDTAFKEITDLEEIKRLGINLKVNPHCYKGSSPTCRLFCKDLPFFFNYNLATIKSFYADGGIEYRNNFERFAKAKESLENGKMDYTTYYLAQTYLRGTGSIMACPHQYDAMVSIEKLSTFYRFESMDIAFNLFDFGNFIWGGAMRKLGFTKETALKWANAHNMATRGFTQDAPADQRAISAGYDAIHD